jgi:hypothetical protein
MMAATGKTRTPGIFDRGARDVVVCHAGGRQRKEPTPKLDRSAA